MYQLSSWFHNFALFVIQGLPDSGGVKNGSYAAYSSKYVIYLLQTLNNNCIRMGPYVLILLLLFVPCVRSSNTYVSTIFKRFMLRWLCCNCRKVISFLSDSMLKKSTFDFRPRGADSTPAPPPGAETVGFLYFFSFL